MLGGLAVELQLRNGKSVNGLKNGHAHGDLLFLYLRHQGLQNGLDLGRVVSLKHWCTNVCRKNRHEAMNEKISRFGWTHD